MFQRFLASTTAFIVIFLKPRAEKFFNQSSGQAWGVANGKDWL